MGISSDNLIGLVMALSSSIFIGSSFIIKKMGLRKAASNGKRAGSPLMISFLPHFNFLSVIQNYQMTLEYIYIYISSATGGHSYLYEPWWWAGMISSEWFSAFSFSFTYSYINVKFLHAILIDNFVACGTYFVVKQETIGHPNLVTAWNNTWWHVEHGLIEHKLIFGRWC